MALNSGCVVSFQETISHLIQLQTATKKRIAEIKECETRIEKAFGYLTKVLSSLFRKLNLKLIVSTLINTCNSQFAILKSADYYRLC